MSSPSSHQSVAVRPSIALFDDYRSFLKGLFYERKSRNFRYSLRSYAKSLGLACSTLSQILSGTRDLSPSTAVFISKKIGLSDMETNLLKAMTEYESCKNLKFEGLEIQKQIAEIKWYLTRPQPRNAPFPVQWIHLALMQAAVKRETLSDRDLRNLAKTFDIEPESIRSCLNDLIQHDFLSSEGDRCIVTPNLHQEFFERARYSINSRPEEQFSGTTMLELDSEGMKKAKELADHFLDQLQYLSKNRVIETEQTWYGIHLHLFPFISYRGQ